MTAADDLLVAVTAGDLAAVERLLAADPGLASAARDGIGAVRLALYHRQPAVLAALLAAAPPLDGLDLAALGRVDDLRRALAEDPGLVARTAPDGFGALHYAAFFGGAGAVAALLEAGADPNAVAGDTGLRPLHSAAAARDTEAAQRLLDAGADPDARQRGGFTALHAAAQHDDAELAAVLLRHGADPALRTDAGADAAGIARAQASTAVLALLGVPTA